MSNKKLILVTGATGYVGGRLVPELLALGHKVRVFCRDLNRIWVRPWSSEVDIVVGDVFDPDSLREALDGVDLAYYLIHSMSTYKNFDTWDKTAARNFADAAKAENVDRIIYLGGLGQQDETLSDHLKSRQLIGEILASTGVAVTEFRAAVIVGSGSISFEMIRHLAERLPGMICPRWVNTRIQPISIVDVLKYLTAALEHEASRARIIEIGGKDILTYREMLLSYARIRKLRRLIVTVPVLTPNLSSIWVHLVTPIPRDISKALIEGVKNEVIVHDNSASVIFPDIIPDGYDNSLKRIFDIMESGIIPSTWHDSLSSSMGAKNPVKMGHHKGMVLEEREAHASCSAKDLFMVIERIGGDKGWYFLNILWRIRGFGDRLVGGVGMRRGRRDPVKLKVGDPVDFWRVEAVEENEVIRLRAEMKLPGKAWLQFQLFPEGENLTRIVQTAYFVPKGLWGLIYWYSLYPVHKIIFRGMVDKIVDAAENVKKEQQ